MVSRLWSTWSGSVPPGGDHAGDVIDLRIFQFTLLEIGNWPLLEAHRLGCLDVVALKISKFGGVSALRRAAAFARHVDVPPPPQPAIDLEDEIPDYLTVKIPDSPSSRISDYISFEILDKLKLCRVGSR